MRYTPKTDREAFTIGLLNKTEVVPASFARELEEDNLRMEEELESLRERLYWAQDELYHVKLVQAETLKDMEERLSAAEAWISPPHVKPVSMEDVED